MPSGTTSLPMPSPGMTAIRFELIVTGPLLALAASSASYRELCQQNLCQRQEAYGRLGTTVRQDSEER